MPMSFRDAIVSTAASDGCSTEPYLLPIQGEASYFSIPIGGLRCHDAMWTLQAPHHAVAAIEDHLAFYLYRVNAIEVTG